MWQCAQLISCRQTSISPFSNLTNLRCLSQWISVMHTRRHMHTLTVIKDSGPNKPLWFYGIKSNWLPDCHSSSLIKRLRAGATSFPSGLILVPPHLTHPPTIPTQPNKVSEKTLGLVDVSWSATRQHPQFFKFTLPLAKVKAHRFSVQWWSAGMCLWPLSFFQTVTRRRRFQLVLPPDLMLTTFDAWKGPCWPKWLKRV